MFKFQNNPEKNKHNSEILSRNDFYCLTGSSKSKINVGFVFS